MSNARIFLNSSEYELWSNELHSFILAVVLVSKQVLLQKNELFQVVQKLLQHFYLKLSYALLYIILNYTQKKILNLMPYAQIFCFLFVYLQ